MSLTLQLPPDMEEHLRREATAKGMAADVWAREIIARHQRRVPRWARLTADEEEQLRTVNALLPPSFWEELNALQRRGDLLLPAERARYVSLWEQAEEWNVRRVDLLESIAQKRGKHFPQLMKALGIRHHPLASDYAAGA